MKDCWNRRFWCGLVVVYLSAMALNEVDPFDGELGGNPQVDEARAWWDGRLDLPDRQWDTAYAGGKVYSHFPPMFTFVSAVVVPFFGGVPKWIIAIIALQTPWLAMTLFHRLTRSAAWATVLAIGLVLGTSAWPVLERTVQTGAPYFVNQTLSLLGILIFLNEYFAGRRLWVLGLGLFVAALSRQLTVALALPLIYVAWVHAPATRRVGRLGMVAAMGLGLAAGPMTLNALKFGHPLESGYLLIYAADEKNPERDDPIARDAKTYGIFSTAYLRRNLNYTNIGLPEWRTVSVGGIQKNRLRSNYMGTGIWWTSPLLLWVFVDIRRIVRDRDRLALLAAAGVMYAALMFYHSTGWAQRGYNRYSLDYIPLLMCLIVPSCVEARRRGLSLVMIAWSVVYFGVLIRPHVE